MIIEFTTKKASLASAGMITSMLLLAPTANAAPEVFVSQVNAGSTTLVEQYANGKTTTITATPNGISMQDGMPFSVSQITNVPRYAISQGTSTIVTTAPIASQVQVTQQVGNTVVTTPINTTTQILTPITTTTIPTLTTQAVSGQTATSQIVSATTLEALQLQPTFSTPDIVSANTKMMKILKNSAGREVAVPANHIAPGDVIEYHTTYVNNTAQPVTDLNAIVSLPTGVKLVSLNSPLSTMGTIGGGSYQTIQQMGNSVVIQENYSGLKWNLVNLAANTPQTVIIRSQVQ